MSTYGTVDFEVLIDSPSRRSSETVTLRSERRVERSGLGVISLQVVSDASGKDEDAQEEGSAREAGGLGGNPE